MTKEKIPCYVQTTEAHFEKIDNLITLIPTWEIVVWNLPTRNFPDPDEFARWIQSNI